MADPSIADFVRDTYTAAGVEVEGEGAGRVLLRMPPTFHNVTGLCRDLVEIFGASCDMVIDATGDGVRCVVMEVYSPPAPVLPAQDPPDQPTHASATPLEPGPRTLTQAHAADHGTTDTTSVVWLVANFALGVLTSATFFGSLVCFAPAFVTNLSFGVPWDSD